MSRAATSPELALYRGKGIWSKPRAAILKPTAVYTARVNQAFSSWDGILEIEYDTGSGTLADILPDMTLLIGSSAGKWDKGICRLRDKDSNTFFIGESSDTKVMNNDFLTVVDDFGLWARHVRIVDGEAFMDGGVAYSNQHTNFKPTPIMGGNRILELTGASISAVYNFASSYALDSTITGYSCSAPGSSSSSGMTTATPTITWNSTGWKNVYLTLTAANGETFFSVRKVYIWNKDNPPPRVTFPDRPTSDINSAGWSFQVALMDECDTETIRDHALVIIFGEDYYGDTKSSIGPLAGCENIIVEGWIAKETIDWNPEQGVVQFTGYTAQYWFGIIPAYPDGVEFVKYPATAWTEIQHLTVNKGVWHFLHWRTTATRIMDVFLTNDTKYTAEVSSLAQNLWEQLREMTWNQIFARPMVNAHNQLYIEVHPQLVPEASRTWPTVMNITKKDWVGKINLERHTVNDAAVVSLSGVAVDTSGTGKAYFALSRGHTFTHYGTPKMEDRLLVSGQAQANQLCALYFNWLNNPFKDIPITLVANNRLIDICPRQKCTITIEAEDTPRGIEYTGGIIPTSVSIVSDPETGWMHTEVTFEAETGLEEDLLAVNGDIPGSGDISVPPTPSFPSFPSIPITFPGIPPLTPDGPTVVLLHDVNMGMIATDDFHAAGPHWYTANGGLTATQYQNINEFFVTPSGAFYVAYSTGVDGNNYLSKPFFLARADKIGAPFTVILDEPGIRPGGVINAFTPNWGLWAVGYNPLLPENVAYIAGQNTVDRFIYIGAGSSFAPGILVDDTVWNAGLAYGLGQWLYARDTVAATIAADGSAGVLTAVQNVTWLGDFDPNPVFITAGTIGKSFHKQAGLLSLNHLYVGENNLATATLYTYADSLVGTGLACDPSGMLLMGRWTAAGLRGRSSDGAATWSTMGSLPFGPWWWAYAGGSGISSSRWVAAGGSSIRYSPDFGATWINKEGFITSVAPIPNINDVKVIKY